ncbi:MAG: DUF4294 domain-containing protein [Bacteroidetes bacterium]|nr:DUF4294 domain-containing protein [Bacteroidota bacterium]
MMIKHFIYIAFLQYSFFGFSQAYTPVILEQDIPEMRADVNFNLHYRQALNKLRRVYPLALSAKAYIVEFDGDIEKMEKNRARKKYGKQAHRTLKDQFIWDIKDLYINEGIMLMKLIHRETGMTVSEIISKYRGNFHSSMYEGMGKIWEQNLNAQYDPSGEDWIIELVINDIIKKRVAFDWELQPLDKTKYKENIKEYRQDKREFRKVKRQSKRKAGSKIEE